MKIPGFIPVRSRQRSNGRRNGQTSVVEEGVDRVFAWTDIPGARYSDHSYPGTSVQVVLSEEVAITTAMGTRVFRSGERFDVGAGEVHAAKAGPDGCTYVVGE